MEILITPYVNYLDPGSGGLLIQLIIGAVASGLVFGKNFYYRIKSKLKKNNWTIKINVCTQLLIFSNLFVK